MIYIDDKEISFTEGMTVADALKEAGETLDTMTLVIVNREVIPFAQLKYLSLVDSSRIKLLRLISGG